MAGTPQDIDPLALGGFPAVEPLAGAPSPLVSGPPTGMGSMPPAIDPLGLGAPLDVGTGPESVKPVPKRRTKRSLRLDKPDVVKHVLDRLTEDLSDRQDWLRAYTETYAKYRGWSGAKAWPWADCSNAHIPVAMYNCQRLIASLANAVFTQRPICASRAWNLVNQQKQERIDTFLDWQVFVEMEGESPLDDFIHNFVIDPLAIAYVPWVREQRHDVDVRVVPLIPLAGPESIEAIDTQLRAMVPNFFLGRPDSMNPNKGELVVKAGNDFTQGTYEIFDRDDGRSELEVKRDITLYDGPRLQVLDIEDVVAPAHAANLQPRSASNPTGATHVAHLLYLTADELARRQASGEFDLLSKSDVEKLTASPTHEPDTDQTAIKQERDDLEGVSRQDSLSDIKTHTIVAHYGSYDVDGDGLDEQVVFWVAREAKLLCRARLLRELFPHGHRPFATASIFPTPNRLYGTGMPQLLEHLGDLVDTFLNQEIDYGTLTNSPFFFYRPSGDMKPETIRLQPGEGYPLGDPAQDINFPQFSNAGQQWAVQNIGLLTQFVERLAGIGDVQMGRVPQGKASALRTTGTTMALLSQGDARTERVLRRLFQGLNAIWTQVFQLDQAFLTPGKEYRVLGVPETHEGAFTVIRTPEEIGGKFHFDFQATMLQANPQVMQQISMTMMQALVSPLLIQLGIVTPDEIYNITSDFLKAHKHPDTQRFIRKPPTLLAGPRITAAQALTMLAQGEMPIGTQPAEPLEQHMAFIQEYTQAVEFGAFPPQHISLLKAYIAQIQALMAQQAQMQQLMAAAGGFQDQMGGGGAGGPGGAEPLPGPGEGGASVPEEGERSGQ